MDTPLSKVNDRFDRLLKAMAHGEPPKGRKEADKPKADDKRASPK